VLQDANAVAAVLCQHPALWKKLSLVMTFTINAFMLSTWTVGAHHISIYVAHGWTMTYRSGKR
jgi:hypothetical protein